MKLNKFNSKVITFVFFLVSVSILSLVLLISQVQQKQDLKSSALVTDKIERESARRGTDDYLPDRIIVKQKADSGINVQRNKTFEDTRIVNTERTAFNDFYRVETNLQNAQDVIDLLRADPNIESAEYEAVYAVHRTPNDSYYSDQWWIPQIKIPEAWDLVLGNASIKIAVIDTGVSNNHPDLSSNVILWQNFSSSSTPYDVDGHGTWVAGIIAALTNNSLGVASSTYSSKIMSLKAMNDQGLGVETDIAEAMKWAVDNGAKIISISLGSGRQSSLVESAVNYAWSRGVIIVGSAGNDNKDIPNYPAAYNNVFSVASTDRSDGKSSFSSFGTWVDIAAPGVEILSTGYWHDDPKNIKNVYAEGEGTSISTPIITGVAALVLSKNSNLNNQQVVDILCNSADKIQGTGTLWKCGRVNAYQAVIAAGGGTPPPTTPPATPPGTPPATGTTSIKVRFQGITELAQDQNISLTILRNNSIIYTNTIYVNSSDDQGVYQINLINSDANITPGSYQLKIKGPSHLTKSFQNISIPDNQTLIDLSELESYQLRSGDVNSDNKITIEDISKVLSYYNNFSTPVDADNNQMKSADVTKDGVITIQDIALIAINWSDLSILGD